MIRLQLSSAKVLMILVVFFLLSSVPSGSSEIQKGDEFHQLKQRLISDGFDPAQINHLFDGKRVYFSPDGVSLFFVHSESSLNYDQFASGKSIAKARKYMELHKTALDQAQKQYGVDKTIITAILLVETRLGTYLGKRTVINTLSTMASLTDDRLKEKIWNSISHKKKFSRKAFEKKVRSRTEWAYKELKALITYTHKEKIAPETIKGSYAGAMGISQFMPSNVLRLARDGDNDGKIDLFTHEDAISSVANYLKHHGWAPGIPRQKQHKVLFSYNHSNYYVDILLKISDKLKG